MYTYKRRLHDVRYQANKTADNFFTKKKHYCEYRQQH